MSKIYIDVGHGKIGEDSGTSKTVNGNKVYEAQYNLDLALACRDYLVDKGYEVTLSRTENVNRPKVGSYGVVASNFLSSAYECRNGDFDLMISIHCNDAANVNASGFLLMWKTGNGTETNSKDLAYKLATMMALAGISQHGVKQCTQDKDGDYYGILRCHDKVGVLVETCFMSNVNDLAKIYIDSNRVLYGKAMGTAIDNYCKAHNLAPASKIVTPTEVVNSAIPTIDYNKLYNELLVKYNGQIKMIRELEESNKMYKDKLTAVLNNLQSLITKNKG